MVWNIKSNIYNSSDDMLLHISKPTQKNDIIEAKLFNNKASPCLNNQQWHQGKETPTFHHPISSQYIKSSPSQLIPLTEHSVSYEIVISRIGCKCLFMLTWHFLTVFIRSFSFHSKAAKSSKLERFLLYHLIENNACVRVCVCVCVCVKHTALGELHTDLSLT